MRAAKQLEGLSLEYKLPLLITLLLVGLVLVGSVFAFGEVRSTMVESRQQRLASAADELTSLIQAAMVNRLDRLAEVADDPLVAGLLRHPGSPDSALVRQLLERFLVDPDTADPVELNTRSGVVVASAGVFPSAWSVADIEAARSVGGSAPEGGYSRLFATAGQGWVWLVMPVFADGKRLGEVANLRPVGSAETAQRINDLLSLAGDIHFMSVDGDAWIALDGKPGRAPAGLRPEGPFTYRSPDGQSHIAHAARIEGAPFAIVTGSRMSAVLERPRRFARTLTVGALLLIAVGATGAWMISRSITRPLKQLSAASAAIASGDYSRRVHLARGDELGALSRVFSRMAAEVESAQQALGARFHEARELAERLEAANVKLVHAMALAEDARADAESASRAKSGFLATMSHEIRTPINAIIGYTDLLEAGLAGPLNDRQARHLERVRASGTHLMKLVDDVLDLSRIEADRLEITDEVMAAAESADAAVALALPAADAKGVHLLRLPETRGPACYIGDPRRVQQILINLLSNAVKFTPAGGRVSVSIRSDSDAGADSAARIVFEVRDTGVGIPQDQLARIFEPFVQGEQGYTRSHGGVGLGLAISRRLARNMGGDIVVSSHPGTGSTFSLWLPGVREPASV